MNWIDSFGGQGQRSLLAVLVLLFACTFAYAESFPAEIDLQSLRPQNGGDGSVGFFIRGIALDDDTGNAVDIIGDFNGDGIDDMLIGAVEVDVGAAEDAGGAYLLFGRPGGFPPEVFLSDLLPPTGDGSEGVVLLGAAGDDEAGVSVRAAGDVNGDGLMDVLVGAPNASSPNRFEAGVAYLVFGAMESPPILRFADLSPPRGDGSRGVVLRGVETDSRAGDWVSGVGDVNGDGVGDLIVGASQDDRVDNQAGASYLVLGRSTPFPPTFDLASLLPAAGGDGREGLVVLGVNALDRAGIVSGGFDVNQDGLSDFAVGAGGSDGGGAPDAGAGSIYLVYGSDTGFSALISARRLLPQFGGDGSVGAVFEGINSDDNLATSAAAGDLNGDGLEDLVMVSGGAELGAGEAYVVLGRQVPLGPLFELQDLLPANGTLIKGEFELEVGGIPDGGSDLNGDGLDDIVLPGRSDAAYLVFGRPSYPVNFRIGSFLASEGGDGSRGVVLRGANGSDDAVAIATGGDVNGDGVDDVLIGARDFDSDRGGAYVLYGMRTSRSVPGPFGKRRRRVRAD
ncbi:MAG: integrin alpha [Pseudomonadota bacterium]